MDIWTDANGDHILIGEGDCEPGDPIIIVPLDKDSVLEWIKALATILEDGEIITVPGEFGKCTNDV